MLPILSNRPPDKQTGLQNRELDWMDCHFYQLSYFSQKLFSAFKTCGRFDNIRSHDVVPIVMGARREDYAAFAPTHSYIHVDDFTGPEQLANYLHLLDRNDTLYNQYFTWKGHWKTIDANYWCRLCGLLHWREEVDYVNWYDDYRLWWNGACDRSSYLPWFQRNSAKR